jgi:hypothetical protein
MTDLSRCPACGDDVEERRLVWSLLMERPLGTDPEGARHWEAAEVAPAPCCGANLYRYDLILR